MNYYGTTVNGLIIPKEVCEKLGIEQNRHRQARLVIKAKSRAAANRRWKELTGHTTDGFRPNYTSITGNPKELELCDQFGEIVRLTDHGDYISLSTLMDEINNRTENN